MREARRIRLTLAGLAAAICVASVSAQTPLARGDYDRALDLQEHYRGLVDHLPEAPEWIEGADQFVYRESIRAAAGEKPGAFRFVLFDAKDRTPQPPFDAERLAASLTKATGAEVKATHLPFTRFRFEDNRHSISFRIAESHWTCHLADYSCAEEKSSFVHDPEDEGYDPTPKPENGDEHTVPSPDGKWTAYIVNNNLAIRPMAAAAPAPPMKDAKGEARKQQSMLSSDGSADNYYAVSTIAWSPDSKHIAAFRIRPGYKRVVDYVESSPPNQLQPIHSTMVYPKAGDVLAFYQPVLFDVASKQQFEIDASLFPNQFSMSDISWWKDSRGFTFEYNQRGHQLYRVVEVDAATGKAHALIEIGRASCRERV